MVQTTHRRTPESLTAVDVAAQQRLDNTGKPAVTTTPKPPSKQELAYQVKARRALDSGLPRIGSGPSINPHLDTEDSTGYLHIDDIEYFEGNPRKTKNAKYEELKVSIKVDGITNILTVTKPPGATKYHPFGGGNTRLAIAKELYKEGDMRFARLFVVLKPWTSTAHVLTAHLSENSNRDDMTFWDAANGVDAVKKNLEKDLDRKLTTNELNQELQLLGVNFGMTALRCFAFALDHLEPVGRWLKFNQIRNLLQPSITGLTKLITHLGNDLETTYKQFITPILQQYANELKALEKSNADSDSSDRKPVELDADALVADLEAAVAEAIGEPLEKLPLMLIALNGNGRMKAAELRAIQLPSKAPPRATNTGAAPAIGKSNDAGQPQPQQVPLAGMLALAPTPAAAPVTAAPVAPGAEQAQRPQVTDPPTVQIRTLPPEIPADSPFAPVLSKLLDICDAIYLNDAILYAPQMPFGYVMDFPADIKIVNGKPFPYPEVRAATWKFLAALSMQLDSGWLVYIDTKTSTWANAISQGGDYFVQYYGKAIGGCTDAKGNPQMGIGEIGMLFLQPEIGYLLTQLLRIMETVRINHPDRFVLPSFESSQIGMGLDD